MGHQQHEQIGASGMLREPFADKLPVHDLAESYDPRDAKPSPWWSDDPSSHSTDCTCRLQYSPSSSQTHMTRPPGTGSSSAMSS